jgi:hypothetical protein
MSPSSATGAAAATADKAAGDRQISFDTSEDRSVVASQAIADPVILAALVENLALGQRRVRQFSAAALCVISASDPQKLTAHIPAIADALHRPEAQTRWECLEALSNIVALDPDACDDAVIGTEASLYDEESGPSHLAAIRFLCAYGALDVKRAEKVWPYIDEALQCYHGDAEFQDMLIALTRFASGKIGAKVKQRLIDRLDFDAKNSKGQLGKRAAQIIALCAKK